MSMGQFWTTSDGVIAVYLVECNKIVPTGHLVVEMEVVIHEVVPDGFYDVGRIKDVQYLLAIVDEPRVVRCNTHLANKLLKVSSDDRNNSRTFRPMSSNLLMASVSFSLTISLLHDSLAR